MINAGECWVCKETLFNSFAMPSRDSWYWMNISLAAAGGTPSEMRPVHHRCLPPGVQPVAPGWRPTDEDDRQAAEMQPNRSLARMIAAHHAPPGVNRDGLARDIEMVLNSRCRAAFKPKEQEAVVAEQGPPSNGGTPES